MPDRTTRMTDAQLRRAVGYIRSLQDEPTMKEDILEQANYELIVHYGITDVDRAVELLFELSRKHPREATAISQVIWFYANGEAADGNHELTAIRERIASESAP